MAKKFIDLLTKAHHKKRKFCFADQTFQTASMLTRCGTPSSLSWMVSQSAIPYLPKVTRICTQPHRSSERINGQTSSRSKGKYIYTYNKIMAFKGIFAFRIKGLGKLSFFFFFLLGTFYFFYFNYSSILLLLNIQIF